MKVDYLIKGYWVLRVRELGGISRFKVQGFRVYDSGVAGLWSLGGGGG